MMKAFKKSSILSRLLKDTSGAFSLIWAVSMTGIIITIGASYDLAQISKAKSIAQSAADNMALTASIAVDFDNDDRYVGGQSYSYSAIGGDAADFTGTMTGSVEYDIDDTEAQNLPAGSKARLLARATITGTYSPAFMTIVPGIGNISFTAVSDVAYAATEGKPASVFFVVDNSGSMNWDDANGANKLASLKTSMASFMTTLNNLDSQDDDIIRTSLYPYSQDYNGWDPEINNDGVIPSDVIDPQWGVLSSGEITDMITRSGTDSSGAMEDAEQAFPSEDATHQAENGNSNPLKFIVFMTDGSNNDSYECQTESVWIPGSDEYWWKWKYHWRRGWYKKIKYSRPRRRVWQWNYVAGYAGGYQDQQTCGWDNWADIQTKASCDTMKDDGVTIYTIGYDLAVGYPKINGVTQYYNNWYTYQSEVTQAEALLSYCASDVDHYILAADADDLQAAFVKIGAEIELEVIRIKR